MTGVEAMAAAFEAMTDDQRSAERQRIDAELARRRRVRRVEALDGAVAVRAVIELARLLAADADDAGRRELLHATADRARAAVEAMRAALAETPD